MHALLPLDPPLLSRLGIYERRDVWAVEMNLRSKRNVEASDEVYAVYTTSQF